jgi:hypothetical protein
MKLRRAVTGAGFGVMVYVHEVVEPVATVVPGWGWAVIAGALGLPELVEQGKKTWRIWRKR